jgi:heme a synthase
METQSSSRKLHSLATFATLLAFVVVVLGAYTRLTDAGLGCPDWPGCYGQLTPSTQGTRAAWTEMGHRYCAGSVGILILLINIIAWRNRRSLVSPLLVPSVLLVVVVWQAALGMWTVTLKLHPVVVMAHLLGGLSILSLLWHYRLSRDNRFMTTLSASEKRWQKWSLLALVLLFGQIALGGWVSANYAGLACIGFPSCNGQWWPSIDFAKVFTTLSFGPNYSGGGLDVETRAMIQVLHRCGALIVASYLVSLSLCMLRHARSYCLKQIGCIMIFLTLVQLLTGILNVLYQLPLLSALLHNAVAALLLLTTVTLITATRANHGEWFHA